MTTTKLDKQKLNFFASQLVLPKPNSHKGQNGKLLVIGGSDLFHAASTWSLDAASRLVDMVFYSSVPENNQLITEAKKNFWNGIVVPRNKVEEYLQEADCILIGPGMERAEEISSSGDSSLNQQPTAAEWLHDTEKITNYLLQKYQQKKWVIDAGALQMVDPGLLTTSCILTPHSKELESLLTKIEKRQLIHQQAWQKISQVLGGATILLKGPSDKIIDLKQAITVSGGNAGMTKGGTGDVLAGLVAGLYANSSALPSCVVASYINKTAGDLLYQKVGPFFNASDLVGIIPQVLWELVGT